MYTYGIQLKMVNYSCAKCGKTFSQKGHYNRHINKKHPCIQETHLKNIITSIVDKKMNNNDNEKIDFIVNNTLENINMTKKYHELGQYFTTHNVLQAKVVEFIKNTPNIILEPSIGQGDLVKYVQSKLEKVEFDMFEIDNSIPLLESIERKDIIYGDFMTQIINKNYKTIVGNPPYVKTKKGNLYIDFIDKCYRLLENDGELIFIIPSDFFKLTSASKLLNEMMENGNFTHIFHPHNENMFANASIDIIVFRYCKNKFLEKITNYNDETLHIINNNGLITFCNNMNNNDILFKDYFDIYVGMVTGKEDVFKHASLGNVELLNGKNKREKYILIQSYPCENNAINNHLLHNKNELISRKIRKFNEKNWFEWGALRNKNAMEEKMGKDCIYLNNLTRNEKVAFVDKVQYFGGTLIMLVPKKICNLHNIVTYMNTDKFKSNFTFSKRFKIGHRQISYSNIPEELL